MKVIGVCHRRAFVFEHLCLLHERVVRRNSHLRRLLLLENLLALLDNLCVNVCRQLGNLDRRATAVLVDEVGTSVIDDRESSLQHQSFCFVSFRSRTPGPPPLSSMNSMPTACRAFPIFSAVSLRPPSHSDTSNVKRAVWPFVANDRSILHRRNTGFRLEAYHHHTFAYNRSSKVSIRYDLMTMRAHSSELKSSRRSAVR